MLGVISGLSDKRSLFKVASWRLLWTYLMPLVGTTIFITFVGCVPVSGAYYRPASDASGGVVGNSVGTAGKEGQFSINRAGIRIIIRGFGVSAVRTEAGTIENESSVLTLDFYVPEEKTVYLSLNEFHAKGSAAHATIPIKILTVSAVDPTDFKNGITLTKGVFNGNRYPIPWLQGHPTNYRVAIRFPDNLPEGFDFYLPKFTVDGIQYTGAIVHFQKVKGVWLQDIM